MIIVQEGQEDCAKQENIISETNRKRAYPGLWRQREEIAQHGGAGEVFHMGSRHPTLGEESLGPGSRRS